MPIIYTTGNILTKWSLKERRKKLLLLFIAGNEDFVDPWNCGSSYLQPAFTSSKPTMETTKQYVTCVQS